MHFWFWFFSKFVFFVPWRHECVSTFIAIWNKNVMHKLKNCNNLFYDVIRANRKLRQQEFPKKFSNWKQFCGSLSKIFYSISTVRWLRSDFSITVCDNSESFETNFYNLYEKKFNKDQGRLLYIYSVSSSHKIISCS